MKTTVKKRGKKNITFIRWNSTSGASHGMLVPLHLPLLGFCFFSFLFFFFYYKFILYITREVPNKAVEKNMRFWSLLSNGNKNYYESIQIEFLKLFAAKTRFVGENYIFTDFCTTQSHLSLRPVVQLVTRPVDKELLVASTCCNDMSPRPISLS